jgi:hypothetical protein
VTRVPESAQPPKRFIQRPVDQLVALDGRKTGSGQSSNAISSTATSRATALSSHRPGRTPDIPTGEALAARRQETGLDPVPEIPARQEPPRPRPAHAWPLGQDGCQGRRAPRSRDQRRSPAALTACDPLPHGASRQWTTPAPHSAAVAQLAAPAWHSRTQDARPDVAPAHQSAGQHDSQPASSRKRPARRNLRQRAPGPPPSRRL